MVVQAVLGVAQQKVAVVDVGAEAVGGRRLLQRLQGALECRLGLIRQHGASLGEENAAVQLRQAGDARVGGGLGLR